MKHGVPKIWVPLVLTALYTQQKLPSKKNQKLLFKMETT